MNAVDGGLDQNVETLARFRTQASSVGADLVLTPELSLTGYPPEDLLLKEGFVEAAAAALDELGQARNLAPLLVGTVMGEQAPGVVLSPSKDARDVASGLVRERPFDHVGNALVALGAGGVVATATKRLLPNYDVFDEVRYFHPGVGAHTIVNVRGVAVGLLICEDVWTAQGPAAELAAQGATLLVVANASPFARGRRDERGRVVARASAFREELLVADVEARASNAGVVLATDYARDERAAAAHLVNHVTEPPSEIEEIYDALVTGTRYYLRTNGFRSAILGVSGGVDSSLVATIAVDAVGARAVRGFAMPSRYSSEHSVLDAVDLGRRLDIEVTSLPIEAAHGAFADILAEVLDGAPRGLTDENLQSRIRGVLLMAVSNATGAIVLTTGNKSELATGYSTLYGDSVGGFAVIKDVPKTLVYELCRYRNEIAAKDGDPEPIPSAVLTKAPSAELRPDQRDDQSLPPYDVLDPLLELYVEDDATAETMIALGHDPELVFRITRLVDGSEYKRRQMPPGVRISKKAFGRDRRMPITNAFRQEPL